MSKANLFMDSSALFAGIVSASGAARVLPLLAETKHIQMTISEQVVAETERALPVRRSRPWAICARPSLLRRRKSCAIHPWWMSGQVRLLSHTLLMFPSCWQPCAPGPITWSRSIVSTS